MTSDQSGAVEQQSLRILQIGKYYMPDEGGIETVTRDISEGLAALGHRADVLCFSSERKYAEQKTITKIFRAKTNFSIAGKSISFDYVKWLRKLSADYDIGLLHTPNPLGMIAALLFWNRPLIVLWHSDIINFAVMGKILRPLERLILSKADSVIVPTSAHVEGSFHAADLRAKAVVIPFPFTPGRHHRSSTPGRGIHAEMRFLAGRKLILAVGRLVPYKGYSILIDAAKTISSDAAICIVGIGPLQSELQSQIKAMSLEDRVLLLGRVDDIDLGKLYEIAHVVTMPSITRAEMYGMTQVEAMSYGKPVVSTNIPYSGVPRVNIHNVSGLIVPVGDAQALSTALNFLVENEAEHDRLSAGAKTIFARDHNLKAAAAAYLAVLQRVVTQQKL